MPEAVQFIVELSIAEGGLAKFKEGAQGVIALVEASEPATFAYRWYFNADETKCYIMEWYPNADVIPAHLQLVGAGLQELLKVSSVTRFEVLGNLTPAAADALAAIGAVNYGYWQGFTRQ